MALSANASYDARPVVHVNSISMVVKASSVCYNGALLSHDTTEGEVKPFDGTQADKIVGWHFGDSVTGNSSEPRVRAKVTPGGFIIKDLTVGGLLNTTADYGAPVYATDDGTYTVTDPGSGQKLGRIVADSDRASGKATVFFFLIPGVQSA